MNLRFNSKIYIERKGLFCPYCGSDYIEMADTDADIDIDGVAKYVVQCNEPDCKKEWRDIFTLTGVEEIE